VLTAADIETRVMTYGGRMHHREVGVGKQLSVLLSDDFTTEAVVDSASDPRLASQH
jgi:hypothetical protein